MTLSCCAKQAKGGYTYVFTDEDKQEIIAAVDKVKATGVSSEEDVKQVRATQQHLVSAASPQTAAALPLTCSMCAQCCTCDVVSRIAS